MYVVLNVSINMCCVYVLSSLGTFIFLSLIDGCQWQQ